MYVARHKQKRHYNHVYSNYDHPVLMYIGALAVELVVITVFMLIAFS